MKNKEREQKDKIKNRLNEPVDLVSKMTENALAPQHEDLAFI